MRRAPRRRTPAARAGHHRSRARPVLLGDEARMAAARRRRRGRVPTSRSARSTRGCCGSSPAATCTPPKRRTRGARCCSTSGRSRGRPSCAICSASRSTALPEVRPSSGRFGVVACGIDGIDGVADQRHRRRPASGAVRPGVLRAGHDEEHLRHRLVRADERRRHVPEAGRGSAHDRRLAARRAVDGRVRVRGRDLRHRRGHPVAARRPRHHRRRVARPRRWRRRSTTPRACSSCPRSPGSARRGGTRTPRGTIVGITRGTGRAHLARAVVEAMAYQTRDVVDAMTAASGHAVRDAARRRRRVGDGPAAAAAGRPAAGACEPSRR